MKKTEKKTSPSWKPSLDAERLEALKKEYPGLIVSSPLVPPRFDAMTENGNSSSGVSHEQILHLASGIQRLP